MEVIALLEARGIDYVDAGVDEIAIICPNQHNHQGGVDATPSFRINIKKLMGHCFSCSLAMSEVGLTKWLMGDDLDDMQLQALKIHSTLRRMRDADEGDFVLDTDDEFTLVPPSTPFREEYRGISASTYELLDARKCSVGRYADRIFFKIWQHNRLLGIDARALKADMQPKYLRPKGVDAKKWLFPFDYWLEKRVKHMALGEGLFHGINGVDKEAPLLTFFGSNNWSEHKLLLLLEMGLDDVTFFGDNDKAGIKARNTICAEIAPWIHTFFVPEDLLPEGKDAGDLTKEEMKFCLENKVRFR